MSIGGQDQTTEGPLPHQIGAIRDTTDEAARPVERSARADEPPPGYWSRLLPPTARDRLQWLWERSHLAITAAVAIGLVWGLIGGWWMPRGPLTTGQALWSMLISLVVGVAAGFGARSRWAILLAPLAFATAFEAARLGTDGPLVDEPRFSTYGVLAFVVGRGFHALLSIVPMALGAALGAGLARGLSDGRRGRTWAVVARRTVAGLTALGLLLLAAGLARPASTDPIRNSDGTATEGSIAELTTVEVGGHDLSMMIRGRSVENPVLLFLAGGPGGSELGAMRNHLEALETHFTVVTWDQRGAGKSYPELDPTDTLTLESTVSDTLAVTDHLRERFGQDRIHLLGQSWGSTLGVLAVQRAPEKYAAYVGTGQMVSQLATDRIFYEDTLAWALATGRDGLANELRRIGPPPYDSILDYETALSHEHDVYPYDHSQNSEGQGGFSENFLVEEYTLLEQVHLLAGFIDTFSVLYPRLQDVDFRETATSFEVPVFFVQGAHEADGRAELFEDWYPRVTAPQKDLVQLDTSGHRPLFEQPEAFVSYMVDTVLERTTP